ncbi:MarR family transcriptional regulator [Actinomycetospora corticicola]|uniref:DNA-binding MarR family transcriptional regulator n=1 Tax=Actinomycetospora corticicola TaxID=663602 RepID=A0A7Y9DXI0_9PSEU|nr:DNA-binding MarR family transcriptional regulator [Actinomycetospora corticicola]
MLVAPALADRLLPAITALRRAVRRRTRDRLGVEHLPAGRVELLRAVEELPGAGVGAVARRLRLAENTVSTAVRAAVADGHLERRTDPADRRAVRLDLTDAARTRLRQWRTARSELVEDALRRLPDADRAVLEAAVPALERLLDAVEGA